MEPYDYEREDGGNGGGVGEDRKGIVRGEWEGMDVWYAVPDSNDERTSASAPTLELEEQDELVFERMAPFEGARWVS